MQHEVDRKLVEALALVVVTEVAPEEAEFFDELAAKVYAQPATDRKDKNDEVLTFGLEGLVTSLSPAAIAMVSAVLPFIVKEILLPGLKDAGSEEVKKWLLALFRRGKPDEVPALTGAQLRRVQERARAEAIAFGVDQTTAERMAKALVGTLATAP